jgi:hypothetical protein
MGQIQEKGKQMTQLRTDPHILELARGLRECKRCKGRDWKCDCSYLKNWWRTYQENVPAHDQHIFMTSLAPSSLSGLSLKKQQEEIAILKAKPLESHAFFGPAGTSKTTFCVALYERGVWNAVQNEYVIGGSIWRKSTKQLMEQHVDYARRGFDQPAEEPSINRRRINRIAQNGHRPCLFLEEIDKVMYTKFKADTLFELIDAIYENNGQLVFNSNLTMATFIKQFDKEAKETGEAIVRRIAETMNVHNYFEKGATK